MIGQVRQGRPQPDQGVIGGRDDEGQGVGPLALDGYTWYVRARNGDGATDGVPGWFYIAAEVEPSAPNLRQPYGYNWSPAKLFTVFSGVRPVALTLLASTGVISETTPAYSWSDKGDADEPQVQIQLRGPLDLAWSAVESLSWLFLSATTGSILESPTLSIDTGELSAGWQSGIVELSASAAGGPTYTKQVSIQIYFGQVERIFLPLMSR